MTSHPPLPPSADAAPELRGTASEIFDEPASRGLKAIDARADRAGAARFDQALETGARVARDQHGHVDLEQVGLREERREGMVTVYTKPGRATSTGIPEGKPFSVPYPFYRANLATLATEQEMAAIVAAQALPRHQQVDREIEQMRRHNRVAAETQLDPAKLASERARYAAEHEPAAPPPPPPPPPPKPRQLLSKAEQVERVANMRRAATETAQRLGEHGRKALLAATEQDITELQQEWEEMEKSELASGKTQPDANLSTEQRLRRLGQLYQQGLLSEQVYTERRVELTRLYLAEQGL